MSAEEFEPSIRRLPREFFARSVHEVASELIGVTLLVDGVGGVIVEGEAYDEDDPASPGFRGPPQRNEAMVGAASVGYVSRPFGVHWCLNVVCAAPGREDEAR